MNEFLLLLLSVYTWALPQPQYSAGLIVNYGGESVVAANADWHGYTLDGYVGGGAAISPAMLGRIMWARTEHGTWIGPLLVVDAVGKSDAYASIYERHEIAELPRGIMAELGYQYGGAGYVWFGPCPPDPDSLYLEPQAYAPPLVWDTGEPDGHKSFYPYPEQQFPVECP